MFSAKTLLTVALTGSIFFASTTAFAYDLPKFLPDKKKVETKTEAKTETKSNSMAASDWTGAELFEQKIKSLLAENENLPASSKERINRDKNLVFVAFYNGKAYFLDRYSIKIKKNTAEIKSWKQHIFPIGKGISPQNSAATQQRFSLQNETFYNSLSKKDEISAAPTDEDKKFLAECFKVGYYYAFKKEIDVSNIFSAK